MQQFRVSNVNIAVNGQSVKGSVTVKDGVIASVDAGEAAESGLPVIDGHGGWLLPGFIDVHVHGGYGADFMDASREAYDTITKFHAEHGTTTMLATTMTESQERIRQALAAADDYRQSPMPHARLGGVHLEGPFISPDWMGAQNPEFRADPQLDWLKQWHADHPGLIKQLTLAPEREGALEMIAWLAEQGIAVAAGHTDAKYDVMEAAADAGLNSAVHTFNACRGLHHREPGTVGAVLTDDRIHAEVIADGHHVHDAIMRLLGRVKPDGKLLLITDAMSAAGLQDGQYELGGQAVTMKDGVCRLTVGGNLAGSTLTMENALKRFIAATGWTVPQASVLASANPAALIGLGDQTGSIAAGKWADLVLLTEELEVQRTWVGGLSVFEA
ncbi:N-acetylglucosamine-6-phosphate deacetylase [Paenibacillus pasadenensis]|uniref:N-acetylglucosamine-6-phosphate deacetylase n=1 Tax=Paenibacillus pasadenensis TaxID=217090 RepID=UPI00203D3FA9|nr:N-acetylglucosamine-6-phosphate deacetylase [Paenibacillus pasadenensis]MCM3746768.1 N-acetylglucosamine-6-phosphate deacetylase [Paenibacillus pasadenensis]